MSSSFCTEAVLLGFSLLRLILLNYSLGVTQEKPVVQVYQPVDDHSKNE